MEKNMKKLVLVSLAFSSLVVAGCGQKQVRLEETQVTKNEYVAFNVSFLKDKGRKYDVELSITNTSKNDIIIMLNDMECFKGNAQGMLKHTFFNIGERTIDFRKGQLKRFRMVCTLAEKEKGDYKILVTRVYDNPESDGATKGKVLASNVEFKMIATE
jgi:hypothetical protein